MSREEKITWGFVGLEIIIIILLLLRGLPDMLKGPTVVNIGGINFPGFDPITLNIETRPPNSYPASWIFGPITTGDINLPSPGDPCACGCDGTQTMALTDLTDMVATMNASLRSGAITGLQYFYSQLPGSLYYLTNATPVLF